MALRGAIAMTGTVVHTAGIDGPVCGLARVAVYYCRADRGGNAWGWRLQTMDALLAAEAQAKARRAGSRAATASPEKRRGSIDRATIHMQPHVCFVGVGVGGRENTSRACPDVPQGRRV
jgi:hypothetical protein